MERKIGEIFEYDGEWYQCLELKGCIGCYFYNSACDSIRNVIGSCTSGCRSDTISVIFKKLEKVGEPFIGKVLHIQFQRYKVYIKPIIIDPAENVNYVNEENTIAIEIKQNQENMKEIKLKPFDIEAAKAGKPVCTRDGRKARIICFDRKDVRPIIALIKSADNDDEGVYYYYADGLNLNSYPSAFDLMMLPEKKEGWVNIYEDMVVYESKEEAKIGISTERNYIATTKVEWEE